MKVGPFTLEIIEPMKACRVTVDKNEVGIHLLEDRVESAEHVRRDLTERLTLTHDVQIRVR